MLSDGKKKLVIKIEGGQLKILADLNKDGEASLSLSVDLQEVIDETGILKKLTGAD